MQRQALTLRMLVPPSQRRNPTETCYQYKALVKAATTFGLGRDAALTTAGRARTASLKRS